MNEPIEGTERFNLEPFSSDESIRTNRAECKVLTISQANDEYALFNSDSLGISTLQHSAVLDRGTNCTNVPTLGESRFASNDSVEFPVPRWWLHSPV